MNLKTRIALLSGWLGVMAFFSFVVAPSAFKVLPTQHLAGQVVSRLLRIALAGAVTPSQPSQPSPTATGSFRPFASRGVPVTNADIDRLRDAEGV